MIGQKTKNSLLTALRYLVYLYTLVFSHGLLMVNFLEIVFCGDLVLDEPNPGYWLSGIAPVLHNADLAVGHLEVPHTRSTKELKGDVPAPGADPDHLAALLEAGFGALTLAGNHMADCGAQGIADTIALYPPEVPVVRSVLK